MHKPRWEFSGFYVIVRLIGVEPNRVVYDFGDFGMAWFLLVVM